MTLKWIEKLNSYSTASRNIAWWAVGVTAAITSIAALVNQTPVTVSGAVGMVTVISIYVGIRAYSYRKRNKRIYQSFQYIHRLTHDIRNALDRNNAEESATGQEEEENEYDNPTALLKTTLDNTAHCFRELTGKKCIAALIMPMTSALDGDHFLTILYCSDVDPERSKTVLAQKGGLVEMAYRANTPLLFNDYEEELKKGNFVKFRPDAFRWYKSGMMAHFKVVGQRWGVLSIDSPDKDSFDEEFGELLCAFADACALVFTAYDVEEPVKTEL